MQWPCAEEFSFLTHLQAMLMLLVQTLLWVPQYLTNNSVPTGGGNGNPLQHPCLENPRNGGAWWTAVYGVSQSQTRLRDIEAAAAVLLLDANSVTAEISKHRIVFPRMEFLEFRKHWKHYYTKLSICYYINSKNQRVLWFFSWNFWICEFLWLHDSFEVLALPL